MRDSSVSDEDEDEDENGDERNCHPTPHKKIEAVAINSPSRKSQGSLLDSPSVALISTWFWLLSAMSIRSKSPKPPSLNTNLRPTASLATAGKDFEVGAVGLGSGHGRGLEFVFACWLERGGGHAFEIGFVAFCDMLGLNGVRWMGGLRAWELGVWAGEAMELLRSIHGPKMGIKAP